MNNGRGAARIALQRELAENPNDFESNPHLEVLLKQDQDFTGARRAEPQRRDLE
jgi:hypothetical protein